VSLFYAARARVKEILDGAAQDPTSKIGAFYASYIDDAVIQRAGTAPVEPVIRRILTTRDRGDLLSVMADLQKEGMTGLFDTLVSADSHEPASYVVYFEQAGIGLPDRSYYDGSDKASAAGRAAYLEYADRLLALSGQDNASARAAAVVALERRIAAGEWDATQRRDEAKTYNRLTIGQLRAQAPGFDWMAYFARLGVAAQPHFIIPEPSAFEADARIWQNTPLAVLKDWLLVRYLDQNAPFLTEPFVDAHFAFDGTAMSGTLQQAPRATRAAALITGEMADSVGRAYIASNFPPAAKTQIDTIVSNVKAAFRIRLAGESWMAPETRQKAIAKLDTFQVVVGYPDEWRDDAGLEIRRDDLVGNVARAERYKYQAMLARLGTRVDRREFDYSAADAWAWATPTLNEIGFTAAFLQPPYFDPNADPGVNYGAIGAVIGHELSHHFDDQGRFHDAEGRSNNWWTPEDVKCFDARAHQLVVQYDGYEPLPGVHVDGALTLGENLADLAGLTISYDAYQMSLHGVPAPVVGNLTGPQRFFLGFGQSYRSKQRDADLRNQLLSDPHPPEEQRAEEVRNVDAWYDAFDVKPDQKLYLSPDRRVKIW
jgi:putative endopeptidase